MLRILQALLICCFLAAPAAGDIAQVGVDEKLGAMLPEDLVFTGEDGQPAILGQLIDKPTLLLLIFYHCPVACNIMLSELAGVTRSMSLKAGEDYQIVTVSFDDEDTPATAAKRKSNYLPAASQSGRDFPAQHWRFLVGDAENIGRLTQAVGYRYQQTAKHAFVHPNVLIVLSPSTKVIRYVYGPSFLPFDVAMAVAEASRETPGVTIRKMLSYCFSFDPKGQRYVLDTMKIIGLSVLIGIGLFVFFLTRKPRAKRKAGKSSKG